MQQSKGDTSIPEIQKHLLDGKDETNNRQNKKQKTTVSQKRRPSKTAGNSEKNLVNIANDLELMELKKYVDSTMTVSDGSMANDHNQSSVIAANGRTVDGPTEHTTDVHEVSVDERNNRQTFGTVFGESLRVLQGSSNEDLLEEKDCCPCKHRVTALDAENKNLQTKCQSLEYEVRNIWSWIHHLNQRNVDQRNQPSSFASFLNESVQDTPDVLVERQAGSRNRIVCPGLTKTYGGYTKSQLEAEIEGISDFSKAAKKLFRFLYTYKEYIGKMLTGGKANSKYQARPPLQDQYRIQIIYEKSPTLPIKPKPLMMHCVSAVYPLPVRRRRCSSESSDSQIIQHSPKKASIKSTFRAHEKSKTKTEINGTRRQYRAAVKLQPSGLCNIL